MELLIGSILAGVGLGWIAVPHCYGMCGPLHISVCALNRTKSFTQLSLFNFGRICGYTFAGFLFGAFGEFINLGPSRFCCELSIYPIRGALLSLLFPGVTIIVVGICLLKRKQLKLPSFNWLSKMLTGGRTKIVAGGACTTLIPCGMLYAAFAMAVGTGSWLGGTIFMFSFVLTQTFFMQLGISVGHLFGNNFKNFFNTSFPWLCILIGLIYIFIFISKIKPI
tara:strand:- start:2163 stop:2831 length:669 start_codon:yes stop_codon:yes gene_type:complete